MGCVTSATDRSILSLTTTRKDIFSLPLCSPTSGSKKLAALGFDQAAFDSLVLLQGDEVFTKSSAALRIAKQLKFPYPLLYVFIILPPFYAMPYTISSPETDTNGGAKETVAACLPPSFSRDSLKPKE